MNQLTARERVVFSFIVLAALMVFGFPSEVFARSLEGAVQNAQNFATKAAPLGGLIGSCVALFGYGLTGGRGGLGYVKAGATGAVGGMLVMPIFDLMSQLTGWSR